MQYKIEKPVNEDEEEEDDDDEDSFGAKQKKEDEKDDPVARKLIIYKSVLFVFLQIYDRCFYFKLRVPLLTIASFLFPIIGYLIIKNKKSPVCSFSKNCHQ